MENKQLFLTLVVVCVVTHIVRTIYEIMKHRKIIVVNKVTFIIVFINMAILWTSWFGLCSLDPDRIHIPAVIQFIGLALVIFGIISFVTALLTIKSLESYDGDLITRGIYSITRHPMYTGFILWLIGMPLYQGGIYSTILGVVFIFNVLFWRHLEEKELETRFASYSEYKKRTIF